MIDYKTMAENQLAALFEAIELMTGINYEHRNKELLIQKAELIFALEELTDLMEDTINGFYKPDSFTTQPARTLLKELKQ